MMTKTKTHWQPKLADKDTLLRQMDALMQRLGIETVQNVTPELIREWMEADGIRPEDNLFSREIIRMRNGED